MSSPLISVIVPTLNGARFLGDALASVARQSHTPLEIVLVDGNSADETLAIASRFSHLRCLTQSGAGMWNAVNEGIAAARGDFIAFLSSDDWWADDKLRLQVDALRREKDADYATGRMKFVRVEQDPLPTSFRGELLEGERVAHFPELLLVRRRLFDRIGLFDEELRISADIEWLARARDTGTHFAVVPELMLYKRVHADNLSSRAASGVPYQRELLGVLRARLRQPRQGE